MHKIHFKNSDPRQLIYNLYTITNKWNIGIIFSVVAFLATILSVLVNDFRLRIYLFLIFMTVSVIIILGFKKLIDILYYSYSTGILFLEVKRKWLITYDDKNAQFIWRISTSQKIKNVGHSEITELPYWELCTEYEHKLISFKASQLTSSNQRLDLGDEFETFTIISHNLKNKKVKYWIRRKYMNLRETLKPKESIMINIEVIFTHAQDLFKEFGVIGVGSKFPRLKDILELEITSPHRVKTYEYGVQSPFGETDPILNDTTSKPEFDAVTGRVLKWELANPLPDYNYEINFLVEKEVYNVDSKN